MPPPDPPAPMWGRMEEHAPAVVARANTGLVAPTMASGDSMWFVPIGTKVQVLRDDEGSDSPTRKIWISVPAGFASEVGYESGPKPAVTGTIIRETLDPLPAD